MPRSASVVQLAVPRIKVRFPCGQFGLVREIAIAEEPGAVTGAWPRMNLWGNVVSPSVIGGPASYVRFVDLRRRAARFTSEQRGHSHLVVPLCSASFHPMVVISKELPEREPPSIQAVGAVSSCEFNISRGRIAGAWGYRARRSTRVCLCGQAACSSQRGFARRPSQVGRARRPGNAACGAPQ
jgi:hypothetical protein